MEPDQSYRCLKLLIHRKVLRNCRARGTDSARCASPCTTRVRFSFLLPKTYSADRARVGNQCQIRSAGIAVCVGTVSSLRRKLATYTRRARTSLRRGPQTSFSNCAWVTMPSARLTRHSRIRCSRGVNLTSSPPTRRTVRVAKSRTISPGLMRPPRCSLRAIRRVTALTRARSSGLLNGFVT